MSIGNLALGFLHGFVLSDGGRRRLVMGLHECFRRTLIALSLVRLGWRMSSGRAG